MLKLKSSILFTIIGVLLTVSGLVYIALNPASPAKSLLKLDKIFSKQDGQQGALSAKEIISTPVPVAIRTVRGIVVRINDNILSVKDSQEVRNFIITKTFDFQQLSSGSVEGGDAKTIPISVSSIKLNQEVLVIAEKDTNYARAVYIIK